MKHKDLRPWLSVIAGGESLVSHAGGVLLVETARRSGLAGQLSRLLGPWRLPLATHDPGKIVADLAIAVALGGDAACDVAVLRAQPGVFGPVASDPTVSRLITRLAADADDALAAISAARAAARERVWHHAGAPVQDGRVVIDLDATLVTAHSEKQDATRTWKKGFGFHPLLGFVDHGDRSGGEPVAELLRPGKAGLEHRRRSRRGARRRARPAPRRRCGPATRTGGWRCWCAPTPPARPRSSPPTCTSKGWSSPSARASPTSTWRTALAHLPDAGVDPGLSGPPAPRRRDTGCRSNPATGPGSPRPPA